MGKRILILLACFTAAVLIVVFIPSFFSYHSFSEITADAGGQGMFQQEILSVNAQPQTVYRMYAEGKYVGVLKDTEKLDAHLQEVYQEQYASMVPNASCHLGRNVYLNEEQSFFTYSNVDDAILDYLDEKSLYTISCTAVTFADAKEDYAEIYVSDEKIFDEALQKYLSLFTDQETLDAVNHGKTISDLTTFGTKDMSIAVSQTIKKSQKNAGAKEIKTSVENVLQYLEYGDHTDREYYTTEEGDTLDGVGARHYGLSASQLMNINRDQIKSTDQPLVPGTKLCITYFESPIDVVVTRQKLQQEEIYYTTVTNQSETMSEDTSQVIRTGMNGLRNAMYVEKWVNGVLNTGTLKSSVDVKQPVNEIVETGKAGPSSIGSGSFRFPVDHAEIFCHWNGYNGHTGVDFIDLYDRWGSVYAADNGTIAETGYNSLEGNWVRIDHHNGYVTYYGHLRTPSTLNEGETVTKGQVIGQIGMTGQATGPYIHFEIEHDGNAEDACQVSGFPSCQGEAK